MIPVPQRVSPNMQPSDETDRVDDRHDERIVVVNLRPDQSDSDASPEPESEAVAIENSQSSYSAAELPSSIASLSLRCGSSGPEALSRQIVSLFSPDTLGLVRVPGSAATAAHPHQP